MDYKTKPIGRLTLRNIAYFIRQIFGQDEEGRFDVIQAFEDVHQIFPNIVVEVVENNRLPANVPGRCEPDFEGNFHIQIKERIYDGACQNIGAYRGHILHEICHAILYMMGYKPILERAFMDNELEAYESMEWQAKALCGEILVPYREIVGMSQQQIVEKYNVSPSCAIKCLKNLIDYPIN